MIEERSFERMRSYKTLNLFNFPHSYISFCQTIPDCRDLQELAADPVGNSVYAGGGYKLHMQSFGIISIPVVQEAKL